MSSLPPEILSSILSFLSPDSLIPYVTVSKEWQSMIEKQTFFTLHLTPSRLSELRRMTTDSSARCSRIRELDLHVLLPEYSEAARAQLETDHDCDTNNRVFTETISTLLGILGSWPKKENYKVSLTVHAQSPSDWRAEPNRKQRSRRHLFGKKNPKKDLLDWRYERSYLRFDTSMGELPLATPIVSLDVREHRVYRRIAPAAVSDLASRLPRLRNLQAWLFDNERKDQALRDSLRNDFAHSLGQWPRSIQHLTLNYPGAPPTDGNFSPLQRSDAEQDPLCLALHDLTQQLVTVDIRNTMIAPELFWPPATDSRSPAPHWPKLTSFKLLYEAATPSGQWLFEKDPRCKPYTLEWEDPRLRMEEPLIPAPQDSYPDMFRTKPAHILNELYIAAGRAAQQMPVLEIMVLESVPQARPPGMDDVLAYHANPQHWFRYTKVEGTALWCGSGSFTPLKRFWIVGEQLREIMAAMG